MSGAPGVALPLAGRVELLEVESEALRGNPAGEPHRRQVPVYLPPGAEDGPGLPCLFLLASFTGHARGFPVSYTHLTLPTIYSV